MLTIDHFGLTEDEILDWCAAMNEAYSDLEPPLNWKCFWIYEDGHMSKRLIENETGKILTIGVNVFDQATTRDPNHYHLHFLLNAITHKPYYQKCKDTFTAYLLAGKNND